MRFIAAALVAAFFMAASPALADVICNPRSVLVEHLKEKYGEQPLAFGLNNDGRLVELFGTPDGKTWTMLITDARGISCVVTSGENWQKVGPKLINPTEFPA